MTLLTLLGQAVVPGGLMNSFLYPRWFKVERASHQDQTAGSLQYGGVDPAEMTLIIANVPCNVEARSSGRANPTGLPADTLASAWIINAPRGYATDGMIKNGDYITDDLGRHFRVVADDCHRLGWKLMVDRLES